LSQSPHQVKAWSDVDSSAPHMHYIIYTELSQQATEENDSISNQFMLDKWKET